MLRENVRCVGLFLFETLLIRTSFKSCNEIYSIYVFMYLLYFLHPQLEFYFRKKKHWSKKNRNRVFAQYLLHFFFVRRVTGSKWRLVGQFIDDNTLFIDFRRQKSRNSPFFSIFITIFSKIFFAISSLLNLQLPDSCRNRLLPVFGEWILWNRNCVLLRKSLQILKISPIYFNNNNNTEPWTVNNRWKRV